MKNNYGGVIWTNHALDRLKERKIKQGDAWATFRRPDSSKRGCKKGVHIYYKTYPVKSKEGIKRYRRIEVVATQNKKKEWVIMSVWSKKVPDVGTKHIGQKHTIWGKILGLIR